MSDDDTIEPSRPRRRSRGDDAHTLTPALVVVWADGASSHLGAVLFAEEHATVFGRGPGDGSEARAQLVRQLPGRCELLPSLTAAWLSRRQLRVQALDEERLSLEGIGKSDLRVRPRSARSGPGGARGVTSAHAVVAPGDLVAIGDRLLLLATVRPRVLPAARDWEAPTHAPGEPDALGLVGESPAMWQLRDRVAFTARQRGHVLVLGPSGAGKERVAQAIHRLSDRRGRALVARNAATIPNALMDVELFGHVQNYPNPGMRERAGLVGEAEGSTLFFDEIGELSDELQAHLLRLMDSGEYQRLGDPKLRVADVRLVAATNRDPEALKPDLRARFRHIVRVPPLSERREDIALIVRFMARAAASEDPRLASQLAVDGEPRIELELIETLLTHPLTLQVRELETLLWEAIAESTGDRIVCPASWARAPSATHGGPGAGLATAAGATSDDTPTPELDEATIRAAIARHDGVLEKVWRELGLRNRYVLRRLIAKFGISSEGD